MRRFAALFARLDATRSTDRKVEALVEYFRDAPGEDAAWALFVLGGGRLRRLVKARALLAWVERATGLPGWLVEQSVVAAGDLAEALALLLDLAPALDVAPEPRSLSAWIARLEGLRGLPAAEQEARLVSDWRGLPPDERMLLTKLATGALRVGVSRPLVERALAERSGLPRATIAARLAGAWTPGPDLVAELLSADGVRDDPSRPYPFMLAAPLDGPPDALGEPSDLLAEWKWDGIRVQVVRRASKTFVWSRGDELVTERFPELRRALAALPDGTVLDGELLAFDGERPLPFGVLQRRIGRTRVTAKVQAEAPVALLAFDLLEAGGRDLRGAPLETRRERLEELLAAHTAAGDPVRCSPVLGVTSWADALRLRDEARARGVEGLVLKRRAGAYRSGRPRGEWWKWKVDPYTFDAVLVAAEPGHGRRASLLTDLTFGVWHEGALVTVARAYSGLTDEELLALDRWVRRNTLESYGPVRAVPPVHVFELRCEGVARSPRHTSGLAVRFPRIARWRTDKRPAEADLLERLAAWAPIEPPRPARDDAGDGPAQLELFGP